MTETDQTAEVEPLPTPPKRGQTTMVRSAATVAVTLAIALGLLGCSDTADTTDTTDTTDDDGAETSWGVTLAITDERVATDAQIAQMQELDVDYAKFWLIWRDVEPQLASYKRLRWSYRAAISGAFRLSGEGSSIRSPVTRC